MPGQATKKNTKPPNHLWIETALRYVSCPYQQPRNAVQKMDTPSPNSCSPGQGPPPLRSPCRGATEAGDRPRPAGHRSNGGARTTEASSQHPPTPFHHLPRFISPSPHRVLQVTGATLRPPSSPPYPTIHLRPRHHRALLPATRLPSPPPHPDDVAAEGGSGRAGGRAALVPTRRRRSPHSPPATPEKVSNRPPPAERRAGGAAAVGRPALTAAGPGASTAPSGDLYIRSIFM